MSNQGKAMEELNDEIDRLNRIVSDKDFEINVLVGEIKRLHDLERGIFMEMIEAPASNQVSNEAR